MIWQYRHLEEGQTYVMSWASSNKSGNQQIERFYYSAHHEKEFPTSWPGKALESPNFPTISTLFRNKRSKLLERKRHYMQRWPY